MALVDRARHWRATRYPEGKIGQQWFAQHSLTEHDLNKHLKGQSVALVGNARALLQTQLGQKIDAHDLVIRMNHAPSLGTAAAGSRLNWLATSIRPVHDSIDVCLWIGRKLKRMPYTLATSGKLYLYPAERRQMMAGILGARASTGAMLIELVLNSAARQISIFGFDFFASLSLSGDQNKETAPHDFSFEANWVAAQIEKDERLTLVPMI